jgi:hypothetical protein
MTHVNSIYMTHVNSIYVTHVNSIYVTHVNSIYVTHVNSMYVTHVDGHIYRIDITLMEISLYKKNHLHSEIFSSFLLFYIYCVL